MDNVLTVKNLNKYFGRRKILDNINLEVKAGEVMGFIGPNGAGKTTAIKVILGFLSDDGGSVNICGYDLKKDYENALGCAGGIVENPDMYKQFSGMLNLEMYARTHEGVTKERINEVVKLVGLENRINDKVKKYSLGMKQMLGLAIAILHNPRLLVLDEPTNGLDPNGIRELREILINLAHKTGVGVLVSSHQLAEMENLCDRATIIANGKVICEKSLSELENMWSGLPTFKLDTGGSPQRALQIVKSYADSISGDGGENAPRVSCDATTGNIIFSIEPQYVPKLVKALVEADVDIYGIYKEEYSLEEAFVAITGGGSQIA